MPPEMPTHQRPKAGSDEARPRLLLILSTLVLLTGALSTLGPHFPFPPPRYDTPRPPCPVPVVPSLPTSSSRYPVSYRHTPVVAGSFSVTPTPPLRGASIWGCSCQRRTERTMVPFVTSGADQLTSLPRCSVPCPRLPSISPTCLMPSLSSFPPLSPQNHTSVRPSTACWVLAGVYEGGVGRLTIPPSAWQAKKEDIDTTSPLLLCIYYLTINQASFLHVPKHDTTLAQLAYTSTNFLHSFEVSSVLTFRHCPHDL